MSNRGPSTSTSLTKETKYLAPVPFFSNGVLRVHIALRLLRQIIRNHPIRRASDCGFGFRYSRWISKISSPPMILPGRRKFESDPIQSARLYLDTCVLTVTDDYVVVFNLMIERQSTPMNRQERKVAGLRERSHSMTPDPLFVDRVPKDTDLRSCQGNKTTTNAGNKETQHGPPSSTDPDA
ncbi:hypothetical protein FRB95_008329 [Tulasnella sp. JGI-2019a]|nr:hypothetical protein FRB95_008329 [Tulasnella sp. JGI-2019a]